jgi:hypothetical protein
LIQLIVDFTDINTLNALYISIFIGITLKFLWARNVEYSFLGSLSEPEKTNIIHPLFFYKKKSCLNGNFILIRIVKYIRRKKSSQDESEEPFSYCLI